MSPDFPRRPRFLLALGLAVAVAAYLPVSAGAEGAAQEAGARPAAIPAATVVAGTPARTATIARPDVARLDAATAPRPVARPTAVPKVAVPAPAAPKAAAPKTPVAKTTTARVHVGTNHLWIPALGISHSVASFSCTRSTPPGTGIYRWGCAGRNNAYLFGHAWSTFKPLHDAYVLGHLHTGMVVYYADATGRVRSYRVTAIKVVTPGQTAWAIAPQPVPSMTLQTCVGSNSQYRLLVRLVATG